MRRHLFHLLLVAGVVVCLIGLPRPATRVAAVTAPVQNVASVPLFRLYHKVSGIHFYTTDPDRKLNAIANGWTPEGIQAYVFNKQVPGTVPFFSLKITVWGANEYQDVFGYTASKKDRDSLLNSPPLASEFCGWSDASGTPRAKWTLEGNGIAGYIASQQLPGTVPLYALYHPKDNSEKKYCLQSEFDNWYTTSEKEMSNAITNHGYRFVGITGYVWPQPATIAEQPKQPVIPNNTGNKPAIDPEVDLLNRGCLRNSPGSYTCPTVVGYEACQAYKNRGSAKQCSTTADLNQQAAMEKGLYSLGCSRFLGRADQFMCKTKKSFDACELYRSRGVLSKCIMQ
jgi:uncharacterized protein DUF5648